MMFVNVLTGNTKKYTEIEEALSHHGITTERVNADIDEIQDLDGRRVIVQKVLSAFLLLNRPVLVDDSGIYFENYREFPGTYSKFLFQAIGYEGIFRLVQSGDRAEFRCFVGYMDTQLSEPAVFTGTYKGVITDQFTPIPDSEMPYALFFVPHQESVPMASMTPEERQQDHRHQALDQFAQWFIEQKNSASA